MKNKEIPKKAGVILKTIERCNINCTYCYYFNKADQSWRNRKPHISMEMIDQFSNFILQGVKDLNITDLFIEFHGGEPLLQRKDHFVQMCEKIKSIVQLSSLNSIKFALQTNGMLIDTEWIKIFKEYDVGIGISLDGTKKLNDIYRLDKRGNSTYKKVVNKIRLCQENEYRFGLLSVINPEVNGADVYNHFTKELKLNHFDFLLPDADYGSLPTYHPKRYGRFMVEVFDEWMKENSDNPRVFIRYCINALELFYGHYSRVEGFGKRSPFVLPLICVSNNGDLGPLDELRTCVSHKFTEYNIKDTNWSEFLSDGFFSNFLNDMENKPDACKQCCYENICGGGSYNHRFYPVNTSFNNPSVYCEGLKIFWHKVIQFLLAHGFSQARLRKVLLG